jgi:hypothetical protein
MKKLKLTAEEANIVYSVISRMPMGLSVKEIRDLWSITDALEKHSKITNKGREFKAFILSVKDEDYIALKERFAKVLVALGALAIARNLDLLYVKKVLELNERLLKETGKVNPKKVKAELKRYPNWICHHCGMTAKERKYPLRKQIVATYHVAECEVCGKVTEVTEPMDYGYPVFKGFGEG